MKKALVVLVLTVVVGTAAFAVPAFGISAGAGGLFNAGFGGGVEYDHVDYDPPVTLGFGGFAFLDATFAELDATFVYATSSEDSGGKTYDTTAPGLVFSLLGKYPIELGAVTVFPLLGVNYTYVLSASFDGKEVEDFDSSEVSTLGFSAGCGLDYGLTDALYLRGEVIYNINLPNKQNTDAASDFDGMAKLGHGPTIKIAVGYQFF
jgi:opacity protein-like surface antigen